MLSFKPNFSLSSFSLIKRLFSSSSLSDIRVVSSAYLRLKRRLADFKCPTGVHLFLASNLIGWGSGSFQVGTKELIYVLGQWSSLNSQRTEFPVLKTLWTLTCVYIYLIVHSYSLVSFINNLRYADGTTLMAESEEELKSFLINVKEDSEKFGLKLNIQKTKIMASHPITAWQIDGETMETMTDFIFCTPKSLQIVTVTMKLKDTCSLEEKL